MAKTGVSLQMGTSKYYHKHNFAVSSGRPSSKRMPRAVAKDEKDILSARVFVASMCMTVLVIILSQFQQM